MSEPVSGYADISLWHETAGDSWEPRPALMGDLEVDVAIVGAGYTGLWTAYYLTEARPELRIAILEAEVAGFGASGRNGGWCSALFPASLDKVAAGSSREAALAQDRAMRATVDEVIRVAEEEGIEADITKGGTITLARTQAQLERAGAEVEHARSWGLGEAELALLDRTGAEQRLAATDTLGATYTPDCAALHPAKLVRGLARVVESRGVTIYEQTPVIAIEPHLVRTKRDVVSADVVVRATEGYTPTLAGMEREVIPVRSLIIATEPLSDLVWSSIGLEERETFSDGRHLLIYGQRTADDRLVFGGRGAPYSFGSKITHADASDLRTHRRLLTTLIEMFPAIRGHQVTHRWGGVLGIPRDWHASVGYDPSSGLAHAGGYVGDGVATTNLAGRTLRDLILGTPSDLTALPWVGHVSPRWEPEPLRWLGVNAGLRAMTAADAEESATGKASLVARAVAPLVGGH
ncbi:NAD(P)/FAD-dependent oxidoreductase [Nocardioides albus]|uniref:Glycine/D-amino acid oxidase-like deaminating enzyme n=1 Tax=Nocardioides albus TaxID=1841 RepID=A0A7W5A5U3_9ACTN|nr:FAD-dependent oxidoreductase [Nocardioides albus]MBB3090000.1 glycine/D-amino acid oxidase-like deaminating enzyme [Nocardioides albus]GGU27009.1 FAD-dependent oxidoreductase [Nocardioides albus]